MSESKRSEGSQFLPTSPERIRLANAKAIPEGAVRISDRDVMVLQAKAIKNWEPASEMWPLKYGSGVCGAMSAFTGILMHHHFRRYLQLMTFGTGSTFLPTVVLPGIIATLTHDQSILRPLVLGNIDCPVCMEIRSATYQVATGFVYPLVMASISCGLIAKRYNLYRMPPFNDYKGLFSLFQKGIQKQRTVFLGLLALQTLGGFSLAQMEGLSFVKLMGARLDKPYTE